jgi:hypothetical protein
MDSTVTNQDLNNQINDLRRELMQAINKLNDEVQGVKIKQATIDGKTWAFAGLVSLAFVTFQLIVNLATR